MKRISENPMNGKVVFEISAGHWIEREAVPQRRGRSMPDMSVMPVGDEGSLIYNGAVTREWVEPRYIELDARLVREQGLEAIAQYLGATLPTGRVNVMQNGRIVGTVPASFDPLFIKSTSYFYDPRPGDFVRDGDAWVANRTIGPGDLDAIAGFRRSSPPPSDTPAPARP